VSWRRLIPLVLVGLLGASVAASAALGVVQSSTSPVVLSPEAQSKLFHADVTRTLASKSFTVHFAGQTTVYEAPNRTEVVESPPGSFDLGMNMVTIGSASYVHFGTGQWVTMPSFAFPGTGSSSEVLSFLRALSSFKSARLNGNTYTVHGVLSDLPKAVVTLIFTVVTHGPNNQSGAFFNPSHPNLHAKVIGRVTVDDGRISSEAFTALGEYPSRGRDARSPTGTITYMGFDSSPAIAAPTKADLAQPATPCDPNASASGSCQFTTKGVAPHSALCIAFRTHKLSAGLQLVAQAQLAPKLPNWSKLKTSELHFLTLEDSLGQAIERSQHTSRDIQRAAQALVKYAHEERLDLLKSKDFSQFKAFSLPIIANMVGALESLAQNKDRECGGTTTYYAMGSEVDGQESTALGQDSTSGQ
jgi:hypothetical protein